MTFKITDHIDAIGDAYLAVDVDRKIVDRYIMELREEIKDTEMFSRFVANQNIRDKFRFHITVFNSAEVRSMKTNFTHFAYALISKFISEFEFTDVKFRGIGTASRYEDTTFFIVVESDRIQQLIKDMDFAPKDLHVTLGFNQNDVFGVCKSEVIIPGGSDFKHKLSKTFKFHNMDFGWLRDMDGFGVLEGDIIPTKIGEEIATFRIGDYDFISISLVEGELRITDSWKKPKKSKSALAHSIVCHKLLKYK